MADAHLLTLAVRYRGRFVSFDGGVGPKAVPRAMAENLVVLQSCVRSAGRRAAGGARYVVTRNLHDVGRIERRFPGLRPLGPEDFLRELSP